jgi:hypothetical protein
MPNSFCSSFRFGWFRFARPNPIRRPLISRTATGNDRHCFHFAKLPSFVCRRRSLFHFISAFLFALRLAKPASCVLIVHDFVDVFPLVVAEPFGGDQFVARRTNAVN